MYLAPHNIVASVRQEGAIGTFEKRAFHLMLGSQQTEGAKQTEAIRIIHQLGFETSTLEIVYPIDEDEPEEDEDDDSL